MTGVPREPVANIPSGRHRLSTAVILRTSHLWMTPPLRLPSNVAVNPQTGLVYVTNQNDSTVSVVGP